MSTRATEVLAAQIPDELYNSERRALHDLGFRLLFNLAEEIDVGADEHYYVATVRLVPQTVRAHAMLAGQAKDDQNAEYLEAEQRFPQDLSPAPLALGDAIREGIDTLRPVA